MVIVKLPKGQDQVSFIFIIFSTFSTIPAIVSTLYIFVKGGRKEGSKSEEMLWVALAGQNPHQ